MVNIWFLVYNSWLKKEMYIRNSREILDSREIWQDNIFCDYWFSLGCH